MNQLSASNLLWQVAYSIPILIVYAVAIVLAGVFMTRAPLASILTLVGVFVLIATGVGVALLQAYVFDNRNTSLREFESLNRQLRIIAIVGNLFRAVGIGLLVCAIFAGRWKLASSRPTDRGLEG